MTSRPAPKNNYFETEEEEASFDEADFDAPVPEYYLREMSGVPEETAAAEVPASGNIEPNSRNVVTKYSESFKVKYKTEMCKNWENTGHCEFEHSCSFAHGMDELKIKTDVPKNYKTKLCKRYHKAMYCPYGARCQFLHGEI